MTPHEQTMSRLQDVFRSFLLMSADITDAELSDAQDAVSTADSIGWVIDPTRYREALAEGSLERQRELLSLFVDARSRLKKLYANDPVVQHIGVSEVGPGS